MTAIVFKLASSVPPKEKELPDLFEVSCYPMGTLLFADPCSKDFENEAARSFDLLPDQVEIYSGGEKITNTNWWKFRAKMELLASAGSQCECIVKKKD